MASNHARRGLTCLGRVAAVAVAMTALAACGDDQSAQDRYCEAGEALRTDILALQDLDLIGEGVDGLESALNTIDDDLEALRDAARESAADEVEALESAVADVESAVTQLGEQLSTDNVSTLVDAIGAVGSAAQDVYATLSDC
jgi:uncharacterized phage infection (PIP) family protein YhgE